VPARHKRGFRADAEFALGGADIRPLDSMPAGASHGVWHSRWLPRPDFRDLLRGARALLYPSLAEGFGLPIVEAMARGVPVLTSGAGAMAEIAGDAAVLVDPLNVTEMAGLIALLDRDTAFRARLAAAGLRRARRFTPHACQGALADVYGRLDPEFP
jgi:glycosyltransferase involved in cell wall biosynthesis